MIYKIHNKYPNYAIYPNGVIKNINDNIEVRTYRNKVTNYITARLKDFNNKNEYVYIHRIVAETFITDKIKGLDINHKDGDKSNNDLSNLEVVNRSQNQLHAFKNGLNTSCGENHHNCKLSVKEVLEIRSFSKKYTDKFIADLYNIGKNQINRIRRNLTWKYI